MPFRYDPCCTAFRLSSDINSQEKAMSLGLPMVFKHHVFICGQHRPPHHPRGSCSAAGALPLAERLGAKVQALGNPEVAMTVTGCMGFCQPAHRRRLSGRCLVCAQDGRGYRRDRSFASRRRQARRAAYRFAEGLGAGEWRRGSTAAGGPALSAPGLSRLANGPRAASAAARDG